MTQVLNQAKGEDLNDEETIKCLHSQNNNLLCQVGRPNDEFEELKVVLKDLKKLVTKCAGSFEPNRRGGCNKQTHYFCF